MNSIVKIIYNLKNFLIKFLNGSRFILRVRKVGLVLSIRGESKEMRLS